MNSPTYSHAQVDRIMQLTEDVAGLPVDNAERFAEWWEAVKVASSPILVQVTARLSSDPGKLTRDRKALREAIIAGIEYKNAELICKTMERLDKAATGLTVVSLIVALVGVVMTVVQVLFR
jgi:hypothetical protein